MAKRSAIEKQKRRERLVALKSEKRLELKRVVKSLDSSDEDRQRAQDELCRLPRDSSRVRLRNRCQISGRPRGYMRKFQISRNLFRELAGFGMVPGLTKSSW